ncbi:Protein of unknown function [Pyronema omphalodes CBS 100304]|uniref:Uncharacterized protein n=1 Tax=Pyronema omphalodes (strain CBS 100304) TaxID=1076935 RepID=U4LN78_PYROM|nr:Protein of unknown function [Pyronema omphalodes CBS 100304]
MSVYNANSYRESRSSGVKRKTPPPANLQIPYAQDHYSAPLHTPDPLAYQTRNARVDQYLQMPDPVIVTPHNDDPYSRLDFASFANTDAESLFEEDVEEMRQGINRRYSEIISTGTPIQEHHQQNWDQAPPKPRLHHIIQAKTFDSRFTQSPGYDQQEFPPTPIHNPYDPIPPSEPYHPGSYEIPPFHPGPHRRTHSFPVNHNPPSPHHTPVSPGPPPLDALAFTRRKTLPIPSHYDGERSHSVPPQHTNYGNDLDYRRAQTPSGLLQPNYNSHNQRNGGRVVSSPMRYDALSEEQEIVPLRTQGRTASARYSDSSSPVPLGPSRYADNASPSPSRYVNQTPVYNGYNHYADEREDAYNPVAESPSSSRYRNDDEDEKRRSGRSGRLTAQSRYSTIPEEVGRHSTIEIGFSYEPPKRPEAPVYGEKEAADAAAKKRGSAPLELGTGEEKEYGVNQAHQGEGEGLKAKDDISAPVSAITSRPVSPAAAENQTQEGRLSAQHYTPSVSRFSADLPPARVNSNGLPHHGGLGGFVQPKKRKKKKPCGMGCVIM